MRLPGAPSSVWSHWVYNVRMGGTAPSTSPLRWTDVPMCLSWATVDASELTGRVEPRFRGRKRCKREREGENERSPGRRGEQEPTKAAGQGEGGNARSD